MKRTAIHLLALMLAGQLSAQTVQIPLSFANVLPSGLSTYSFTVGAHPAATAGVDSALQELEIPSLPPPAGVFIVYSVPPTPDYIWLSPRDIRPLTVGEKQLVTYEIGVTWNGGRLEIGWGALPRFVDSAYIVDVITDFPNNFIKQKLVPGSIFSTSNSAITKLKILVWYDATNYSSVAQGDVASKELLFPNPTDGIVRVKGAESGARIDVMDITGRSRFEHVVTSADESIDMVSMPPGVYSVRIMRPTGEVQMSTIVRR